MDAAKAVENVLTHFGTKGMKWGVRKDRPSAVTVTSKGKKLKTSGGHGRPASPEAVRARTIGQIGKKSGLKALSNQELEAYTRRLNLEAQVKRLNYAESPPIKKFVLNVLGQSGKNAVQDAANEVGTKAVKKHVTARVLKKAALTAA